MFPATNSTYTLPELCFVRTIFQFFACMCCFAAKTERPWTILLQQRKMSTKLIVMDGRAVQRPHFILIKIAGRRVPLITKNNETTLHLVIHLNGHVKILLHFFLSFFHPRSSFSFCKHTIPFAPAVMIHQHSRSALPETAQKHEYASHN
jgi:hypothetical protein